MENLKKDSFVFYRSFIESALMYEGNDQLELLTAICKYALDGTEPNFTKKYINATWISIKPNLDSAAKNREAKIANGKKGGRGNINPNNQSKAIETHQQEKVEVTEPKKSEEVIKPTQPEKPIINNNKLLNKFNNLVKQYQFPEDISDYIREYIKDGTISSEEQLISEIENHPILNRLYFDEGNNDEITM